MLYEELSGQIIGAAIAVHKTIGPGLKEQSYHAAMAMEMLAIGLEFQREPVFRVTYRGAVVGEHIPDFIVQNAIVLELKATSSIEPVFTTQVLTYLRLSGLRLGLIINFNVDALRFGIKRIVK
jgi:GxxExxY protein